MSKLEQLNYCDSEADTLKAEHLKDRVNPIITCVFFKNKNKMKNIKKRFKKF